MYRVINSTFKKNVFNIGTSFKSEVLGNLFNFRKFLHKNKIGALLVYCGKSDDPNNLVGIITERDVIEDISMKGAAHLQSQIKDIMSSKIIKVSPDNTTDEAMDLMIDNQIRHLAVMENDKLLGVVSMRDIVKKSN